MTSAGMRIADYIIAFAASFAATLALVPPVREMNRRFGMVDNPGARRINKTPVPRGGGLAVIAGTFVPYTLFAVFSDRPLIQASGMPETVYWRILALSCGIGLLGYADDRFSLRPRAKLAGQIVFAFLAWCWAGLGFHRLWPGIPPWLDCAATVFWIVGAVNAFNLIDGLDGLASGLALIATLGMGLSLAIVDTPQTALFHLAFAGALLGFLRYNFNPASVFLGDCGSMFIGFMVSILPLVYQTADSFAVSVGVPLLAMGVPIFDTFLAIFRRTVRHLINKRSASETGSGQVMTADADHLHHRLLRASGGMQRKATLALYALAICAVAVGLGATALRSKAGGLWLAAFAFGVVVVLRDMSMVEFFDAGRLLNAMARDKATPARRRRAYLATPLAVFCDIAALAAAFAVCAWAVRLRIDRSVLKFAFPVMVFSVFAALAALSTYRTVWSRAMASNYVRLLAACMSGTVAGCVLLYYSPVKIAHMKAFALAYAFSSFALLAALRSARGVVRDFFYAIDCSRLKSRKDVSRILVYGAGLRYRAFRRELVRSASANDRIIVGILDDDLLLKGRKIGGIEILGGLSQAPAAINAVNADCVVIACDVSESWMQVVRKTLAPTGVRVTKFSLSEENVPLDGGNQTETRRK